ncbi:MAG: PAS domain-containing protein [Candidatus Sedimenticola endophacoides]
MSREKRGDGASLIDQAGVTESLELTPSTESAWIEVIHKMDSVYADLVRYQVQLEEKNSALEEAYQFINSVLAAMTDVLIVCDTDAVVLQVNSALERLTGKPESSFLGRPLEALFGAESAALAERFPERLGSESLIDCEVSLICDDGASAPLAMNCSSRYDHEGGLVGMVLIGRPVGELRRAYDDLNRAHQELQQTQQQLVHSEKMASLGRLVAGVAGVAHELNNPISVVFGNMHALQRYGSRITRYLAEVAGEADTPHLLRLRDELKIGRILDDMGPLIDGTLEGAERVSDIVQDLRRYSGGQEEGRSRR